MNEVWIALIGVCGTLAAGVISSRMQRIASERAEDRTDRRHLADQKASALATFAAELVDYRRAELRRWHEIAAAAREGKQLGWDDAHSAEDARRMRSATWASLYRLRLLWQDDDLNQRAESLVHSTSQLEYASAEDEVKAEADRIRDELGRLTDDARQRLAHRARR